jgi:hypothetical protein
MSSLLSPHCCAERQICPRTWRPERVVCVAVGGGGAAAGAGAEVLLAGELKIKLPWSDSFNV